MFTSLHMTCLWQESVVKIISHNKTVATIKHKFRSSRSEMFFKIGVLKNVSIFIGKYLCWSFFFKKMQDLMPTTLLRDSNRGVFQ